MGSRYEVEVTITSAKDLKNVNWRHGKLKPYAIVWVDPSSKSSTHIDDEGDTFPQWNHKLTIPFSASIEDSTLYIDIVHSYAVENTKPLIGSAKLPLRNVVDDVGLESRAERNLELKRPSGRPQGKVDVSLSICKLHYHAPDPYYAPPYGLPSQVTRDFLAPPYGNPYSSAPPYAAPPSSYPTYGAPSSGYLAYGASPSGYPAYGAPLSGYPAYGAPLGNAQPNYGQGGYNGQQGSSEEKKKKINFKGVGTGLAVGVVAGALGGLALAKGVDVMENRIADDMADRVEDDLGYDSDDY